MKILVINSGSSSIKYQFFNTEKSEPLCRGIVERIGSGKSSLRHYKYKKRPFVSTVDAVDHNQAIRHIFGMLTCPELGVIGSYKEISAIGHRVVHGAELFSQPTLIDTKVIKAIEKFNDLAPLHNPPALLGIRACRRFAKGIAQVAVFDTAFHQTIPSYAYIYGIPYEFYSRYKIRRYGFHGTSHKFVAEQAARIMKRPRAKLKLVTCHLGNGCSITAIKNGRSMDTSMGLTPLEGLLMGTRCGDIDPAVVLYIMEKKDLSIKSADNLLNKESGMLGLSGISNDMRDIQRKARAGNKRSKLTLDIFVYRIKKYIGAYTASMDGLDAIVLTGGIGENSRLIRKRINKGLKNFLTKFNAKLLVIPTNEELMISREAAEVIKKRKK